MFRFINRVEASECSWNENVGVSKTFDLFSCNSVSIHIIA